MEIDKVFFSRGVPIQATVALPEDSGRPRAAVILCHGHSRHKNDGLDCLSRYLVQAGFITMRMDFRGCGVQAANRYELYCGDDWCEDLMSAISYLKTIPQVDSGRIGAAGISMGAATVVAAAGADSRIKSAVAMAGIGDCERWLRWVWQQNGGDFEAFAAQMEDDSVLAAATGRSRMIHALDMYHKPQVEKTALLEESFLNGDVGSFVSLGSLRSLLRYKPVDRCQYITCPIFFAHGQADDIVPQSESVCMYEAVASRQKKLQIYPGMEHNLPMDPARDMLFADITKWFQETLSL